MNEGALAQLLLYDDNTLADSTNTSLLNSAIEFITYIKRFDDPSTRPSGRLMILIYVMILSFYIFSGFFIYLLF